VPSIYPNEPDEDARILDRLPDRRADRLVRLVDEDPLMVNPVVLGGGKALLNDVKRRHQLKLGGAKVLRSGVVSLLYTNA
jgi:hypothetical protein